MLSESERHGPPTHQASQLLGTQQGAKYVQRMEQSNKIIQRENEERYGRKTTTHVSHGGTLPPTSSVDEDNDVLTLVAKSSPDATTVLTLGTIVANKVVFNSY